MRDLITIILAAGKGTRMKSQKIKVLHKLAGKPMLQHLIDTVKKLDSKKVIVVVGYQGEQVQKTIQGENLCYVYQHEQKGTGHAILQAEEILKDFQGDVLVLYGDTPLLTIETLQKLFKTHVDSNADATILSTYLDDPTGYGRIVRDKDGRFLKIVEQSDLASEEEEKINEINTGIYIFNNQKLFKALHQIQPNNAQGEYYLTDVFNILLAEKAKVEVMKTLNSNEIIGINDRVRLAEAEKILRRRINERLMIKGVTIIDPETTYIDEDVEIGQDTIIYPFTFIEGKTRIGKNVLIGPHSRIKDAQIGDDVNITNSVILESIIHERVKIGPFAHIRPGNEIHADAKIGDFVELKKSIIGKGSKVPHLSYVGDAQIGEKCNIGAGTITANYDGKNKHKTKLGNGVFIGSNSTLVAPVELKDGARTGAGSVVTRDVPANTTVVGVPARKFKENKR
ncbi:UDP-N-acetylglucosamine diphosphorylase/glucosamine-1-phosphate N-acetyltransferase [Anoxybacter fermentans]|uniref:Bifunctional protein GlmU n=1 Tax=Anoxybacter fermentans TaxID=1323375 RepID=A0A3S9T1X1_9FIRM|nr:bifunctional UDP-N-acetylglucosamine diphosphorylase/glucosamine-1-phosphate N-acetyltransferase GlmU [Anoxybacter fermentans]AZR74558.1 UDP-N-acetylglucosamine diphosphorylase/glucosamine-1-phosphate N-acetyltransferase [Anoxybacter fermentans]